MATYKTKIEIDADASPLSAGLKRARADVAAFGQSFKAAPVAALTDSVASLTTALGPAALGAAALAGVASAYKYAGAMQDLAGQTNLTASQAAAMSEEFDNAGLGAEGFVAPVVKVTTAITQALAGNKDYIASLQRLGLNLDDVASMDAAGQINSVISAMDPSKPETMAAGFDLLGTKSAKAFQALKAGAPALLETNIAFDVAAANADELGDSIVTAMNRSKIGVLSLAQAAGNNLKDSFKNIKNFLTGSDVRYNTNRDQEEAARVEGEIRLMNAKQIAAAKKDEARGEVVAANLANETLQGKMKAVVEASKLLGLQDELNESVRLENETAAERLQIITATSNEIKNLLADTKQIEDALKDRKNPLDGEEGQKQLDALKEKMKGVQKEHDDAVKRSVQAEVSARKEADSQREAAQKKILDMVKQEKDARLEAAKAGLAILDKLNPKDASALKAETRSNVSALQSETFFGKDPKIIKGLLEKIEPNIDLAKKTPGEIGGYDADTLRQIQDRARGILSGEVKTGGGSPTVTAAGVPGVTVAGQPAQAQDMARSVNAYQSQVLDHLSSIRGTLTTLTNTAPVDFRGR